MTKRRYEPGSTLFGIVATIFVGEDEDVFTVSVLLPRITLGAVPKFAPVMVITSVVRSAVALLIWTEGGGGLGLTSGAGLVVAKSKLSRPMAAMSIAFGEFGTHEVFMCLFPFIVLLLNLPARSSP